MMMTVKGFGRRQSWRSRGAVPAFAWRDMRSASSFTIAMILAVKQHMAGSIKAYRTCCNSYSSNISQQRAAVVKMPQTAHPYTVKPLFIVFGGGLKRNNGSGKTIDVGAIVEIGFAQGP
jgi:hypothetical protein